MSAGEDGAEVEAGWQQVALAHWARLTAAVLADAAEDDEPEKLMLALLRRAAKLDQVELLCRGVETLTPKIRSRFHMAVIAASAWMVRQDWIDPKSKRIVALQQVVDRDAIERNALIERAMAKVVEAGATLESLPFALAAIQSAKRGPAP